MTILANSLGQCMTEKMYSSSYFFFSGYEKCLSLLIPQWAVSLCVSGSVASVVRSTRAALSPFQSQYFVVIAADCFQGGDHINSETCGSYVTLPSLHHTSFQPLSSFTPSFLLFFHPLLHPWGPSYAFICFLIFVFLCIHSSLHLFSMDLSLLQSSILAVYLCLSSGSQ